MPGNAQVTYERLHGLLDAVVALSGDLSLERLLARIVHEACEVMDAKYAFLGVLEDGPDRRLSNFIVHGLDESQQRMIGELPQGRGLLGFLIDHPSPLRLEDLHDHPASFGFPDNHPEMTSFLGVPIRVHGQVFGNLYLTEKSEPGGFTAEDQEIAVAFASAAGVAIENARLYEQAERQKLWLQAAADITTALLEPISRSSALQLVVDRTRQVSSADFVTILMPADDRQHLVEAVTGDSIADSLGQRVDLRGTVLDGVVESRSVLTVQDAALAATLRARKPAEWPDVSAGMAFPLESDEGTGVLVLGWLADQRPEAWAIDPTMPLQFAKQAALVLQVTKAQADRARLAVFEDRDRIGRDLHDLVIQRLFAIGLTLDNIAAHARPDPAAAERISQAVDDIDATIKVIRRTIFDLAAPPTPANLTTKVRESVDSATLLHGLQPILDLDDLSVDSIAPLVSEHLIAALGEALTNVTRHADASEVHVQVRTTADHQVVMTVRDNGRGFGSDVLRRGLENMAWRAQQLDGQFDVVSSPGHGTTVEWSAPVNGSRTT